MLMVSDPQPVYAVTELTIKGYAKWLRDRGYDVHEFATAYVERTVELGYPPSLADSVNEFAKDKAA